MTKIIRLTESDIKAIVKESICSLILKEGASDDSNKSSTLHYAVMESNEYEVTHFKEKLFQLKRTAESAGAELEIDMKRIIRPARVEVCDPISNTKKHVTKNVPFVEFSITPNMPNIQVPNHKYIGSVVPMYVDYMDNGKIVSKETTLVTMSSEFAGNDAVKKLLQNSSFNMVCDGCHREATRGIYYCFFDLTTRTVKKLGSKCASKYFGIDVSNKVATLFAALSHLGEEPYVIYDEEGFPIDKVQTPKLGSIEGQMSQIDKNKFEDKIIAACMAIAKYGPTCNMKQSLLIGNQYISIKNQCRIDSMYWSGNVKKFNKEMFAQKMEEAKHQYPDLFQIYEDSKDLKYEFLSSGLKFFVEFEPNSEFEEKIKNIGMLICGGRIQKKQIGKFSYENFIPYCVSTFFKYKEMNNTESIKNKIKPIEAFSGRKVLNVQIESIDKKQTSTNKIYYQAVAVTDNNELVKWYVFNEQQPSYKRGSKIQIQASYNTKFKSLDNVIDITNTTSKEQQAQSVQYPEDGFRYKNAPFTILKLAPTFLLVKNNNDNSEYFISNQAGGFGYHDSIRPKFDLDNYREGDVVNLSATTASYQGKNGLGHKLLRVQGL